MFVLDTNVFSELLKSGSRCDRGVRRWFDQTAIEEIFLSVIVLGEIRKGAESVRRSEPARAAQLERWLRELKQVYRPRILFITDEVADTWGKLSAIAKVSTSDGLIGATATYHRMTVITRNEADFQRLGVDFFNPFTERKS